LVAWKAELRAIGYFRYYCYSIAAIDRGSGEARTSPRKFSLDAT